MAVPHLARVDGRLARSERSRAAVVDALLALLEEGYLRPTAAQIAERAGLSLRLIFQHFSDVDALFAAAADRQTERLRVLTAPGTVTGSLERRIADFVRRRSRLLQAIDPVRRASVLMEPFSREVATRLAGGRRMAQAEVEAMFAPELGRRPPAERRELVAALAVASDWSTWDALRRHQRLPVAAASRVMARTLAALLRARD
jgi:AcrR family transcriptional regulator